MAEEEREGLMDFRLQASVQTRHELAVAFATFEAAYVTGVAEDRDPHTYVDQHTPELGTMKNVAQLLVRILHPLAWF